jgi:hypothetical protein
MMIATKLKRRLRPVHARADQGAQMLLPQLSFCSAISHQNSHTKKPE